MARKRFTVTAESDSGRNLRFHDNYLKTDMTRAQFVSEINKGNYPRYTVKMINGLKTPVSKPDSRRDNNLG